MKVIIESDEQYPHYRLYDDIKAYNEYGKIVEVPIELIEQYNSLVKQWDNLQQTLEDYWQK